MTTHILDRDGDTVDRTQKHRCKGTEQKRRAPHSDGLEGEADGAEECEEHPPGEGLDERESECSQSSSDPADVLAGGVEGVG